MNVQYRDHQPFAAAHTAVTDRDRAPTDYSGQSYGAALAGGTGNYAPHNRDAPLLEGKDYPGLALMILMALGPLTAYAVGF